MIIQSKKQLRKHLKNYKRVNSNLNKLKRLSINPLDPKYKLNLVKSGNKVYFKLEKSNNMQLLLIGIL